MESFIYHRATSVKQVFALLRKGKGTFRPMAGGTDLMVQWKGGRRDLAGVVDIKDVAGFRGIVQKKGALAIGPCTTLTEIAESPLLKRRLPLLPEVALRMGSPQVRNRATLGGNLANAAPSADMAPPLMALDAKVQVVTATGRKTVPLHNFFVGPGETILGKNGLLGTVTVPVPKPRTRAAYEPLTLREAMDISVVSAAVTVRLERKKVKHARIVLGAVAPVPLRATAAEKVLLGSTGDADAVAEAARAAAEEAKPITDQRGSRQYRKDMVAVVVGRALTEVIA